MKRASVFFALLAAAFALLAQDPPGNDIYRLSLTLDGNDVVMVGTEPVNITHRPGYDNQPAYTPDGKRILYTSIRDGQADSWAYSLDTQAHTRLTDTTESEYSPTPLPDGSGFSVVRVEEDGTQRLWSFDWDGGNPRVLLEDVKPVGYHAWLNNDVVALFILGATEDDPHTMQLARLSTGKAQVLDKNIDATFASVPGQAQASYMSQSDLWQIRSITVDGALSTVAPAVPERAFFAWGPQGQLLASDGAKIRIWDASESTWGLVVDLSDQGIGEISRLAVDPLNRSIAFVVAEPVDQEADEGGDEEALEQSGDEIDDQEDG